MSTRQVIVIMLSIFSVTHLYGQPWLKSNSLKNNDNNNINFYNHQSSFNYYWKDKDYVKGRGFKQFKRWENFMEPRVYPTGYIPLITYSNEILNLKASGGIDTYWENLGPSLTPVHINDNLKKEGNGRLNVIAFHPDSSQIFWVGSPSGGLWKTTDGGNTYAVLTDTLGSLGVSDIAINPNYPDSIFIVTGDIDLFNTYSIGILMSPDGGNSWQTTSLNYELFNQTIFGRIKINPDNPNHQVVTSNLGIYYTLDAWQTYNRSTDVLGQVISGNFKDLEYSPDSFNILYACSFDPFYGNASIYKSTDGGYTFNNSMNGMEITEAAERIEIAVTPVNPQVVYAVISDYNNSGYLALYKSSDKGSNWEEMHSYSSNNLNLLGYSYSGDDIGGQGFYDLCIAASPSDESTLFVGGINVWKSTDNGQNWEISSHLFGDNNISYVHADHHYLAFHSSLNTLFSCNDGGLYYSENLGETWNDISNGLEITQVYNIDVSQQQEEIVIIGSQDNGTLLYNNNDWFRIIGGDGMVSIIDYENPQTMYFEAYNGLLFKSIDGGYSIIKIMPDEDLRGAWVTPFVISQNNSSILYIGYQELYKSTSKGSSWQQLTDNLTHGANIECIAISKFNENYIYLSTKDSIWRSKDGGNNWIFIKNNLPNLRITDIEIADSNPEQLWVTFSGFSSESKVYTSTNAGDDWVNYSLGLPNLPVNCILYQRNSNKVLYAGTDHGVYYRNGSMSEWTNYNGNLPNVIVNELAINYIDTALYAGTFGRGVWKTRVLDSSVIAADFISNKYNACIDAEIKLAYTGSHEIDSLKWGFDETATVSSFNDIAPVISYNSTGYKSVQLTVYKNADSIAEVKNNIIQVYDTIYSILNHDLYFSCYDSVYINLNKNNDYSINPKSGTHQTKEFLKIFPEESTKYAISVNEGKCSGIDSLTVIRVFNDNICDAETIEYGLNGPFSNSCATVEENEPSPPFEDCNSQFAWCDYEQLDNTLWFTFKVNNTGNIAVDCQGFDSQIALYEANSCEDFTSGTYTLLAANDNFHSQLESNAARIELIKNLPVDQTVWLQVDGSDNGRTGMFTILLSDTLLSPVIKTEKYSIKLFPNPNDGQFSLSLSNELTNAQLKITDLKGRLVYNENGIKLLTGEEYKINLSTLKSGIYFINLIEGNKHFKRKLIIK